MEALGNGRAVDALQHGGTIGAGHLRCDDQDVRTGVRLGDYAEVVIELGCGSMDLLDSLHGERAGLLVEDHGDRRLGDTRLFGDVIHHHALRARKPSHLRPCEGADSVFHPSEQGNEAIYGISIAWQKKSFNRKNRGKFAE